ncbi:hypothetical protein [Gilvibacter sp. SZ-19]|uniref:hypothetical protein n=1 Tax=Gilvibacter sp. SZ-19 TaxID=754429 RepID=UPI0012FA29CB|nr:hypothetical protein [Gilvibacter sp. SZ-19]
MEYNKLIEYTFRGSVLIYGLLAAFYFLSKPFGLGDESQFIADLQLLEEQGYYSAVAKGVSIPYMILSYPFNSILSTGLALRVTNLVMLFALAYYFYRRRVLLSSNFFGLLLFYISSYGYFYLGTNDAFFTCCLAVVFVETSRIKDAEANASPLLLLIAMISAVFTRELILVYLPACLLALWYVRDSLLRHKKKLYWAVALVVLLLALNYPSLKENGKLAYDQKLPPTGTVASWPQRQYLAQLMVNQGALSNYNHPSWEQTDAYLGKYGENALPRTVSEAMLQDPAFTIKEFVKDFIYVFQYTTRSVGLIYFLILGFALIELWKKRSLAAVNYIPLALLGTISVFALIIISFVELRWLAPLAIGSLFYFERQLMKGNIPSFWKQLNQGLIVLLCVYGSYNMFIKLAWIGA